MTKHILHVDDSMSLRQMVAMALSEAQYKVTSAVDGNDGLGQLSRTRFDMIITDLNMPGKDGVALVAAARARPEYQGVPILVLSTESEDAKRQRARDAGATGWIVKPFDRDKLLAVVRKLVG